MSHRAIHTTAAVILLVSAFRLVAAGNRAEVRAAVPAVAGQPIAPDSARAAGGEALAPGNQFARGHVFAPNQVATPRVWCAVPTPGPTPSSVALYPNLRVRGMSIDTPPCECDPQSGLGVRVEVWNSGGIDWAPFVVDVNGRLLAHEGLHAFASDTLWFPGSVDGETVARVDTANQVFEDNETDNELAAVLPTPAAPPACTPHPNATPTPAALPDLKIEGLSIGLIPGWQCGDRGALGIHVGVRNQGLGDSGPFVVEVDGTPQAFARVAASASSSGWFPGYAEREQRFEIDRPNQVAEADESNNVVTERLPVPTMPACPSPTASSTPQDSPSPSATATSGDRFPTPTPSSTGTEVPTGWTLALPWAHR